MAEVAAAAAYLVGVSHATKESAISGAASDLKVSSIEFAKVYKHSGHLEPVRKELKRGYIFGLLDTPEHRSVKAGKTLSAFNDFFSSTQGKLENESDAEFAELNADAISKRKNERSTAVNRFNTSFNRAIANAESCAKQLPDEAAEDETTHGVAQIAAAAYLVADKALDAITAALAPAEAKLESGRAARDAVKEERRALKAQLEQLEKKEEEEEDAAVTKMRREVSDLKKQSEKATAAADVARTEADTKAACLAAAEAAKAQRLSGKKRKDYITDHIASAKAAKKASADPRAPEVAPPLAAVPTAPVMPKSPSVAPLVATTAPAMPNPPLAATSAVPKTSSVTTPPSSPSKTAVATTDPKTSASSTKSTIVTDPKPSAAQSRSRDEPADICDAEFNKLLEDSDDEPLTNKHKKHSHEHKESKKLSASTPTPCF